MTTTQDILSELAAAGTQRRPTPHIEDHNLAALRNLLLATERQQIKKILQRLDDPATRAEELSRVLPQAIAARQLSDDALAAALTPSVQAALGAALRRQPDLLTRAARRALIDLLLRPWRIVAGVFPRRDKNGPAAIEQLVLVHRAGGQVLQQVMLPAQTPPDPDYDAEQRSVASMLTYLLAFLRDPENIERYSVLGHLRIERLTYGIHVGKHALLISVIRAPAGVTPAAELARCEALLADLERDRLAELASAGMAEGTFLPALPLAPNAPEMASVHPA